MISDFVSLTVSWSNFLCNSSVCIVSVNLDFYAFVVAKESCFSVRGSTTVIHNRRSAREFSKGKLTFHFSCYGELQILSSLVGQTYPCSTRKSLLCQSWVVNIQIMCLVVAHRRLYERWKFQLRWIRWKNSGVLERCMVAYERSFDGRKGVKFIVR